MFLEESYVRGFFHPDDSRNNNNKKRGGSVTNSFGVVMTISTQFPPLTRCSFSSHDCCSFCHATPYNASAIHPVLSLRATATCEHLPHSFLLFHVWSSAHSRFSMSITYPIVDVLRCSTNNTIRQRLRLFGLFLSDCVLPVDRNPIDRLHILIALVPFSKPHPHPLPPRCSSKHK